MLCREYDNKAKDSETGMGDHTEHAVAGQIRHEGI